MSDNEEFLKFCKDNDISLTGELDVITAAYFSAKAAWNYQQKKIDDLNNKLIKIDEIVEQYWKDEEIDN